MKIFKYTLLSLSLLCSLEMAPSDNRQKIATSSNLLDNSNSDYDVVEISALDASEAETPAAGFFSNVWQATSRLSLGGPS